MFFLNFKQYADYISNTNNFSYNKNTIFWGSFKQKLQINLNCENFIKNDRIRGYAI